MKDVARSGLEVLTWNFRSGAADVDVSGGRREEGGPGRAVPFRCVGLLKKELLLLVASSASCAASEAV